MIDLGDGGVRAADVVRLDLEPRDGVGVRGARAAGCGSPETRRSAARLGRPWIIPRHTAVARSASTPWNARSDVGSGVLLGRVEVEVLASRPCVRARHLRARAATVQLGLHTHLAARRAEPERDPLQRGVGREFGALGREHPALVGQVLLAHVAQVGARADDDLGDAVEQPRAAPGPVLLPDLGFRALLEHDQGAPGESSSTGAGLDRNPTGPRSPAQRARGRARPAATRPRCGRRTGRRSPARPSRAAPG